MGSQSKLSFTSEIAEKLNYYVYRLIDPRNGDTFYIGKGKGNRVFAHCAEAQAFEGEDLSDKLQRIRDIHKSGFEVAHVIHRHGMSEKEAREVEGALIDAYPGLTNQAEGYENGDRGVTHAQEIVDRWSAPEAHFLHKAMLISINRTIGTLGLYDATRHAWKIDPSRAREAEVVLAVSQGRIIKAFVAEEWMEATNAAFPGFPERLGRWGFRGHDAPQDIAQLYENKRVPEVMRKKGSANPIRYTY